MTKYWFVEGVLIFTFAGDMVSPELIAALAMAIHLAVVLENLSCGLIVPLHTLQVIRQPLTPC